MERISPKKVSRQILQNLDALRKIGISAVVRRSNGRRLIELQRAESDDTRVSRRSTLLTLPGRCAAICGRFPGAASKLPQDKRNAVLGRLWPTEEECGCSARENHLLGGGQHRVCLVIGTAAARLPHNFRAAAPHPILSASLEETT